MERVSKEDTKIILNNLIVALNEKREYLLGEYLMSLSTYTALDSPMEHGLKVIEKAGLLHDIDRHLTNLHLELKRLEAIEAQVAHA